jgi:hypothetical protein
MAAAPRAPNTATRLVLVVLCGSNRLSERDRLGLRFFLLEFAMTDLDTFCCTAPLLQNTTVVAPSRDVPAGR